MGQQRINGLFQNGSTDIVSVAVAVEAARFAANIGVVAFVAHAAMAAPGSVASSDEHIWRQRPHFIGQFKIRQVVQVTQQFRTHHLRRDMVRVRAAH